MKKKIIISIIAVVLVLISFVLCFFLTRDYVFNPVDGIWFTMSESSLKILLGEPDSFEEKPDFATKILIYAEEADDYEFEKRYYFITEHNAGLGSVAYTYTVSDPKKTSELFDEIYNSIDSYYSRKIGYFSNKHPSFAELGNKIGGAGSITVRINCEDNIIYVFAEFIG